MLKFHQVYRVETSEPVLQYKALTGAAPAPDGRWVFWRWRHDPYEDPVMSLEIVHQRDRSDGSVAVTVRLGSEAQPVDIETLFVPVTVDFMIDHPGVYGITPEFLPMLRTPGMREAYFSMDVAEEYLQAFEPPPTDGGAIDR